MKVVILIGLSGSGKSTKAAELAEQEADSIIHSTDEYHKINGEYIFQPKKLGYFHKLNLEAFKDSVSKSRKLIIVDNTNLTKKERHPYITYAKRHNYKIDLITIGDFSLDFQKICADRNTHGVNIEIIKRMAKRALKDKVA